MCLAGFRLSWHGLLDYELDGYAVNGDLFSVPVAVLLVQVRSVSDNASVALHPGRCYALAGDVDFDNLFGG